jgi:hypothetical protein
MNNDDLAFARRIEESFIQLGPSGQATPYQCVTCGACIMPTRIARLTDSLIDLGYDVQHWQDYDGRGIHLRWHDEHA